MTFLKKLYMSVAERINSFDFASLKWENLDKNKLGWLFSVLFHPIDAFNNIKYRNRGSAFLGFIVFIMLFLTDTSDYFLRGFLFNTNRPSEFNLLLQFIISDLIILLWCISNWCTTTLMDGEGSFKEIWVVTNYSMLPKIILGIPLIFLSHFISIDESIFYRTGQVISVCWVVVILFIGTMIIHQYSFKKTLISSVITILFMCSVVFICLLFVSIFQQMTTFIETVLREAINRY